jgi:5-methyltetrahydrofolate--homocysteine methyltransferase
MNKTSLLSELSRRPLCCDGAMGTQLLARGLKSGECGMTWNLDRPADVGAIHQAYRDSGCDLITSNSFGGSQYTLERHGLGNRMAELNRGAARVAGTVAGDKGWVLGDVGPFGDFLEPLGDTTADDLLAVFRGQIDSLLAGGADAILVETMSDPAEAVVGVEAAKFCDPKVPVIVTYAFQKTASGGFRTMMGADPITAVQVAIKAGADIVGANCGTSLSLDDYVELARQIVRASNDKHVIVQPNAGAPRIENGQTVYNATPEQMADTAMKLLAVGVRIVGGCCGTTPAHLASINRAIKKGG